MTIPHTDNEWYLCNHSSLGRSSRFVCESLKVFPLLKSFLCSEHCPPSTSSSPHFHPIVTTKERNMEMHFPGLFEDLISGSLCPTTQELECCSIPLKFQGVFNTYLSSVERPALPCLRAPPDRNSPFLPLSSLTILPYKKEEIPCGYQKFQIPACW